MRAAIVCTLKNPPALDSWIKHHLAAGFDHLFLFFDDPREAIIPDDERITVAGAGPWLRDAWRSTAAWARFDYLRDYAESEVMARQALNAGVAAGFAHEQGIDWLLHLDSDELFHSPDQTAREHFQALTDADIQCAVYPNYEAIPEAIEIADPFTDVTLFKVNRQRMRGAMFTDEQRQAIRSVPQLQERFFNYYTNGKCAARVKKDLLSDGPHRFLAGAAVTCKGQSILHYPVCGFTRFLNKYQALGAFADTWFGEVEIRLVEPFHLEARDVFLAGDRAAALEFYQARVMIDDTVTIDRLLAAGVLTRIKL